MKKISPRHWRKLDRHPLSAEYPDLKGPMRQRMIENIREHGVINRRKVTLAPDPDDNGKLKVLDGWQMYSACIEVGTRPEFQPVPPGMTPEEYVEIVNDTRRHETPEIAVDRAVRRRERVARARADGESLRAIAEKEGVSAKTVQRDLDAAGVAGATPEKVTGKDGRKYPARQAGDAYEGPVRCLRCTRTGKDGEDCPACKRLREKEPRRPRSDASKNGAVLFDRKAHLRAFASAYGPVVRAVDSVGRHIGQKETPQAEAFRRRLADIYGSYEKWLDDFGQWAKDGAAKKNGK